MFNRIITVILFLFPSLFNSFAMGENGCGEISAQVAINTTGTESHASAMLDVSSDSRGLLIPRVNLTSVNDNSTIASPAT
jgi:hypothetical protein